MTPTIARNLGFVLALCAAVVAAAQNAPAAATPYKVVDGYKVDDFTMTGFRTWRDRKSTRLNSSHLPTSRMPSSA